MPYELIVTRLVCGDVASEDGGLQSMRLIVHYDGPVPRKGECIDIETDSEGMEDVLACNVRAVNWVCRQGRLCWPVVLAEANGELDSVKVDYLKSQGWVFSSEK